MAICARLVQDDLAIMFEKPDGQYYLLAGAILLAGFWFVPLLRWPLNGSLLTYEVGASATNLACLSPKSTQAGTFLDSSPSSSGA